LKTHIGWCNVYHIDNEFNYTINGGYCTIGINIPCLKARRKGYATSAWKLLIEYLLSKNIEDIYTQTWSGNTRLIALANKVGFEECNCNIGERSVKGVLYDGLTFKLNKWRFKQLLRSGNI